MMRHEILSVAETIAREKGLDLEEIMQALEASLEKVARGKYGDVYDIRVSVHRKTGDVLLTHHVPVVETDSDDLLARISVEQARSNGKMVSVGDELIETLPPFQWGRTMAQTVKQMLGQRLQLIERSRQYEAFKDRVGTIVSGIVRRVESGSIVVEVGASEALLSRDEMIPRERFSLGDRVRAYVLNVEERQRGYQIFLSRSHPQFMVKLFAQEVPEIHDGDIEVKAAVRDPGSRAKIAVVSHDMSLDPVRTCIGVRGSRVQAVTQELQGEKIDIIPWSENKWTFIVNALTPAAVLKVIVREDEKKLEVVIPDDQQSIAIGRRGQNVRLASKLVGVHLDLITESAESERRHHDIKQRLDLFISALDVDDVIGHLLIQEGFERIEDLAAVDVAELLSIDGFSEDVAQELKVRAQEYLTSQSAVEKQKKENLALDDDLKFLTLPIEFLSFLADNGIQTRNELAEKSTDDMMILGCQALGFQRQDIDSFILQARAHWFSNKESSA